MKQLSLRNMFGVMTIICIILFLTRRFLTNPDTFHAMIGPYYPEVWILGLEDFWPFEEGIFEKLRAKYLNTYMEPVIITTMILSLFISVFVRAAVIFYTAVGIHKLFFKNDK